MIIYFYFFSFKYFLLMTLSSCPSVPLNSLPLCIKGLLFFVLLSLYLCLYVL